MSVDQLGEILASPFSFGLLILFAAVIVLRLGLKDPPGWVPGWMYRELNQDRDDWKQLALTGTTAAEAAAASLIETASARTEHLRGGGARREGD